MNLAVSNDAGKEAGPEVPRLTVPQTLRQLAAMFAETKDKPFEAIPDVLQKEEHTVNLFDSKGTALQPIIDHLNNHLGIPTDPTVGGLRKSLPDLSLANIDYLLCAGKDPFITGYGMADRLRTMADILELPPDIHH